MSLQNVYVSDTGNQMVMKVNLADKSCIPFGWTGRYAGPGIFRFALTAPDQVMVFTDHSVISFLKDGTPCQSIILEEEVLDTRILHGAILVAEKTNIKDSNF